MICYIYATYMYDMIHILCTQLARFSVIAYHNSRGGGGRTVGETILAWQASGSQPHPMMCDLACSSVL